MERVFYFTEVCKSFLFHSGFTKCTDILYYCRYIIKTDCVCSCWDTRYWYPTDHTWVCIPWAFHPLLNLNIYIYIKFILPWWILAPSPIWLNEPSPPQHTVKRRLTHPTHITALSQHLVSFQQVVSHQLADFVLSLPASLDHLHLCLCRRLPLKVLVICGRNRNAGLI